MLSPIPYPLSPKKRPRVALVADWIIGGGAEQVLVQLHKMYPEAPIYTSYCSDEWRQKLDDADIRTGYLQRWPFSKLRKFLSPLRMHWFSHLKLEDYDLVISSSGAEAKAVRVREDAVHATYCHAPTHYYWGRYEQYMQSPGFGWLDPLARLGLKLLVGPMRRRDYEVAGRVNYFIANSNYIKEQIKKYYNRDSVVIHPPVAVEKFSGHNYPAEERSGFVTVGRQTPYKRFDIAVRAATLANQPLLVIGAGPAHRKLKKIGDRKITFIKESANDRLAEHLGRAKGFVLPGLDDFGIAAVEAMAAGTPILAYRDGGALDYVNHSTGRFFEPDKPEALAKAMTEFANASFNHQNIAEQAKQFSAKQFSISVGKFLKSAQQMHLNAVQERAEDAD